MGDTEDLLTKPPNPDNKTDDYEQKLEEALAF